MSADQGEAPQAGIVGTCLKKRFRPGKRFFRRASKKKIQISPSIKITQQVGKCKQISVNFLSDFLIFSFDLSAKGGSDEIF